MQNSIRFFITAMVITALLFGCSSGGKNPVMPRDPGDGNATPELPLVSDTLDDVLNPERNFDDLPAAELGTIRNTFNALGTMGAYELSLDADSMSAELISIRTASLGESFLVSGASFFTVRPCIDCLRIESIELTPENTILVQFAVRHPFEKGVKTEPASALNRLDLDVFDLAIVIVPYSASYKSFPLLDVNAYSKLCQNVDGFTRELADLTHNPHACPYYLVVDESGLDEHDYNRFEMGTTDVLVPAYFAANGKFRIYLTMGYGASADFTTRLSPVYYNPEFNRKSAWKVEVIPPEGENPPALGNTWNEIDTSTTYDVTIKVYDWQQNATVATKYPDYENRDHIYASSKVKRVTAEVMNMTNDLRWEYTPVSGDGSPLDPLIYKVKIANEKGLSAGEHFGLVKVSDERHPALAADVGTIDSLVHSPDGGTLYWNTIPEFATYQIFTATVVPGDGITVIHPNGGETWGISSSQTVTWSSTGTIANVNIELSLDSGSNFTVPIANTVPNTGSFIYNPVGNFPTENARVRIYNSLDATIVDESDNDFTIEDIQGPIQVITPNGGEIWAKNTQQNITWTADADITYVRIYLSMDSGLSYTIPITGSTQNDGIHQWNIPEEAIGINNRIKVQKLTDPLIFDESDADFQVVCPVLNPPASVTASDGTYNDKVSVYWDEVAGASGYDIYRDNVLQVANHPALSWEDVAVVPGTIYNYQIASINSCGAGLKGPADPGEPGNACVLPTSPTGVSATDGNFPDKVTVTWNAVAGVTGYNIYRDSILQQGNYTLLTWDDTSVTPGVIYNYQVEAFNGCGTSAKSPADPGESGHACVLPDFPTGVDATDDAFPDRVTVSWNVVIGATGYDIYRDSGLVQDDFVGLTWDDMTVVPGTVYYYQVEAVNTCGNGAIAPPDPGEPGNACVMPLPPTGVSATDGNFPDKVTVSWNAAVGATGYNIYRDSVVQLANHPGITWDDMTVTPGVVYNYQVETVNGCGTSALAPVAPGEPGNACVLPVAPAWITASDGTFTDRIQIDWALVAGATGYNIYRDLNPVPVATNVAAPTWDDSAVNICENHDYEASAVSACGEGPKSASDTGYSEEFPAAPTGVNATDDAFPDKVTVSWNAVTGATSYDIYRDTILVQDDFAGLTWDDTTVTPGTIYNYQVEAVNACGNGPIAPGAPGEPGNACVLPTDPTGVDATDGTFPDKVTVSWNAVGGATGYNIYRDSGLVQANHPGITWDDTTAVPPVVYNYQVEAINGCGVSNKAPADPGEPGNACELPDTPTGLAASDGTHTDRVQLSWTAAAGALSYDIIRNSGFLINVPGITHDDMTATAGVIYTYEVEAVNACGNSPASAADTGYAFACAADTNDTCGTADQMFMNNFVTGHSVSGCVDMIDEDWFYVYAPPNGITAASTIDITMPSGTLDIEVYGIDPGGTCPGALITSQTNIGTTTVNVPASSLSLLYIKLIGNSGEVSYTMDLDLAPWITNMPVQVCVATDDGTPGGNWPYDGTNYLDLARLNQMITWANNFWHQYGYNLNWDGSTVTIMDWIYYNLDNGAEVNAMHTAYHTNNLLTLYWVNQLDPPHNTAYCRCYTPESAHNVNNVFTAYSPNVWTWESVVEHENGHAMAYYFDEYLYNAGGCACGDNGCLGYVPWLYWCDNGCYNGNLMYYHQMGWTWDLFNLVNGQWQQINEFNFNNPTNYPWF
ncbi:hypothetical protein J7L05_06085 [bacterium]|nr:hypothetical protein [bacterium]